MSEEVRINLPPKPTPKPATDPGQSSGAPTAGSQGAPPTPPEVLEKPENIKFDPATMTLSFDKVQKAIRYGIWIRHEGGNLSWIGQTVRQPENQAARVSVSLEKLERSVSVLQSGSHEVTLKANDGTKDSKESTYTFNLTPNQVNHLNHLEILGLKRQTGALPEIQKQLQELRHKVNQAASAEAVSDLADWIKDIDDKMVGLETLPGSIAQQLKDAHESLLREFQMKMDEFKRAVPPHAPPAPTPTPPPQPAIPPKPPVALPTAPPTVVPPQPTPTAPPVPVVQPPVAPPTVPQPTPVAPPQPAVPPTSTVPLAPPVAPTPAQAAPPAVPQAPPVPPPPPVQQQIQQPPLKQKSFNWKSGLAMMMGFLALLAFLAFLVFAIWTFGVQKARAEEPIKALQGEVIKQVDGKNDLLNKNIELERQHEVDKWENYRLKAGSAAAVVPMVSINGTNVGNDSIIVVGSSNITVNVCGKPKGATVITNRLHVKTTCVPAQQSECAPPPQACAPQKQAWCPEPRTQWVQSGPPGWSKSPLYGNEAECGPTEFNFVPDFRASIGGRYNYRPDIVTQVAWPNNQPVNPPQAYGGQWCAPNWQRPY